MIDETLLAAARARLDVYAPLVARTKPQDEPMKAVEPVHRKIVEILHAVARREIQYMIFLMPPDHGKSSWISERFPEWVIGNEPMARFMSISASEKAPRTWSQTIRITMQSPIYRAIFPGVELTESAKKENKNTIWSVRQAEAHHDPTYQAFSIDSDAVAHHCDFMIGDDIVSLENSRTAGQRDKTDETFRGKYLDRVTKGGVVLLVGQRYHKDDLYGRLIAEGWPALELAALMFDENGVEHALCPSLWPVEALHEKRNKVTKKIFNAKYQQNPEELSLGGMFERGWFQEYAPDEVPELRRIIQFYDTATKTKERNDYSVCGTAGVARNGIYILEWWRRKLEGAQLAKEIKRRATGVKGVGGLLWKPSGVYLKNNTDSAHLISFLRSWSMLSLREAERGHDKCSDAEPAATLARDGYIFVPRGAPWLSAFYDELEQFPNGAHDDQTDTLAGLVKELHFVAERKKEPRRGDPLVTGVYHEDERRPRRRVAGGINPMARRSIAEIVKPRVSW